MKSSYAFTRRRFMRGLTAGSLASPFATLLTGNALTAGTGYGAPIVSREKTVTLPCFFDCNRDIGPGFPKVADFPVPADLLAEMDRLNIDRSLVWHTDARTAHPLAGNQTLIAELAAAAVGDRMILAFVVAPSLSVDGEDHHKPDFAEHVSRALSYLDELGLQRMIIAEHTPYQDGELDGLTRLERGLAKHPDRFNAYLSGQAFLQWDEPPTEAKLDALFSRGFYVGFKTHTDHWKVPITDPRFEPMWAYANKYRLPILLHTWTTENASPKLLREIAPRFPDAFFVLAHSGNRDRGVVEELMEDNLNVYLEWAGSFVNTDDWRPVMDRQGNQRIVWGADGVGWEHRLGHSPAWEMGRFLSIGLSDERLIPMLGANMQRILSKKRPITLK